MARVCGSVLSDPYRQAVIRINHFRYSVPSVCVVTGYTVFVSGHTSNDSAYQSSQSVILWFDDPVGDCVFVLALSLLVPFTTPALFISILSQSRTVPLMCVTFHRHSAPAFRCGNTHYGSVSIRQHNHSSVPLVQLSRCHKVQKYSICACAR